MTDTDAKLIEQVATTLIACIDPDPSRDGLAETPARFARMWREFTEHDPGNTETTFESVKTDQMVAVHGIRVWSMCEHHLLPFWCDVSIGYLTGDRVLGLSKFARIAHQMAHRLQLQERLVDDIATEVERVTGCGDVAVIGHGQHLCMVMRGVRTPATMTTSVMRGRFRDEPGTRAEFMRMIK